MMTDGNLSPKEKEQEKDAHFCHCYSILYRMFQPELLFKKKIGIQIEKEEVKLYSQMT